MTAPLSPAESLAYVEIYAAKHNTQLPLLRMREGASCDECQLAARAVVAAVRSSIEADLLDALADAAEEHGPPSVDHLRGIAFIARQGRSTVDWLAESAARPTSEEH